MIEKKCNGCGTVKPLSDFYKQERCLGGVRSTCKACFHDRKVKYYHANKEALKAKNAEWCSQNDRSEYYAQYRKDNQDKIKEYTKTNAHLYSKNRATRRARLLQRTPLWLNDADLFEIECIYKYCNSLRSVGLNYEVDHIIPIAGKTVSGLHVPENLQVILSADNRRKANK